MKISRLFEIVYLLIERKTITAAELAGRFEVSVRTIYRDIDALSSAGIPVYATQGKGGGISILDRFILNKAVISEEEQLQILSALQSIQAVEQTSYDSALSKLGSLFQKSGTSWIEIDFTDWSSQKQELYQIVKTAILEERYLSFQYYSASTAGSLRTVEPLRLWFKERTWYLKAFCLLKQEYRLFKLSRIRQAEILPGHFHKEHSADYMLPPDQSKSSAENNYAIVTITMLVNPKMAYRIYDEIEEQNISLQEDGSLLVTMTCPENDWIYGTLTSYGPYIRILSPPHVIDRIRDRLEQTLLLYPPAD